MLRKIIAAKALDGHRIYLRFEDGVEGTVEFKAIAPFKGVFSGLQDQKVFEKMTLNAELGTVQWENGADLAPEALYARVTGRAAAVSPGLKEAPFVVAMRQAAAKASKAELMAGDLKAMATSRKARAKGGLGLSITEAMKVIRGS